MRRKPEKGRHGTPAPSHPAAKCLALLPVRADRFNRLDPSKLHLNRFSGFCVCALVARGDLDGAKFELRKPGARESARNLEVGGCGGYGRRYSGHPDGGPDIFCGRGIGCDSRAGVVR
jgi:hypothetical protein